MPISHDHNFKNLILDYPREALAFFAPSEAAELLHDPSVVITPLRQEQLKDRLGDRFFELDVPLQVEWPDGRREALLFVVEEESDPRRFSIHRLVSYCAALAEACATERVVPVVIFLKASRNIPRSLRLGSEHLSYLEFSYIACVLPEIPAQEHLHSKNLVARLNLPNMLWSAEQKIDVYGQAIRGLLTLESNRDKQQKYVDFIDTYLQLDDNEQEMYAERYPQENQTMETWSERHLNKGIRQGRMEGRLEGRLEGLEEGRQSAMHMLTRLLSKRFGPLDEAVQARLQAASLAELEAWHDRVLDVDTLAEVFQWQ